VFRRTFKPTALPLKKIHLRLHCYSLSLSLSAPRFWTWTNQTHAPVHSRSNIYTYIIYMCLYIYTDHNTKIKIKSRRKTKKISLRKEKKCHSKNLSLNNQQSKTFENTKHLRWKQSGEIAEKNCSPKRLKMNEPNKYDFRITQRNLVEKKSLTKAGQKPEEIVTRRSLRPVCVWDTTRYNWLPHDVSGNQTLFITNLDPFSIFVLLSGRGHMEKNGVSLRFGSQTGVTRRSFVSFRLHLTATAPAKTPPIK